jgi:hypothetical protein
MWSRALPQLVARHASTTPFTTVTEVRISGTVDLATDAHKQNNQIEVLSSIASLTLVLRWAGKASTEALSAKEPSAVA